MSLLEEQIEAARQQPIIDDPVGPGVNYVPPKDPSIGDILESAFVTENIIGAAFMNGVDLDEDRDPLFNPLEHVPERHKEDPLLERRYLQAGTVGDIDQIAAQIDKELEHRETLEEGGALGIGAMFLAGALDPINFIPIGGLYKASSAGARLINAAKYAATTSAAVGVQELALHSQQQTRTTEESIIAMSAGGLLGGILGGAMKTADNLAAKGKNKSSQELINDFEPAKIDDAGAMRVNRDKEFEGFLMSNKAFEAAMKIPGIGNATTDVRMMTSDLVSVRVNAQMMSEFALMLQKNELGHATERSVFAMKEAWDGSLVSALNKTTEIFSEQLYGDKKAFAGKARADIARRFGKLSGDELTYAEFDDAITKARSYGGSAEKLNIPDKWKPAVEAAAKEHTAVYQEMADELNKLEVFDKMPTDQVVKYVSTVYKLDNPNKHGKFINRYVDWMKTVQDDALSRLGQYDDVVSSLKASISDALNLVGVKADKDSIDALINSIDDDMSKDAIRKHVKSFVKKVVGKDKVDDVTDSITDVLDANKKILGSNRYDRFVTDLSDDELTSQAEDIINRITSSGYGVIPWNEGLTRSKGKNSGPSMWRKKKLQIPMEHLIEDDLIETSAENLLTRYVKMNSGKIEYLKKFGYNKEKHGVSDPFETLFKEQAAKITDEYNSLVRSKRELMAMNIDSMSKQEIDAAIDKFKVDGVDGLKRLISSADKDADKLRKAKDQGIKDARVLFERVMGIRGIPNDPTNWGPKAMEALSRHNYMTMLGFVQIASIPDVARPMMVNGFKNVFGDVIWPMIKNFKGFKESYEELRDIGVITDLFLAGRLDMWLDATDEFRALNKAEKVHKRMADAFSSISLLAQWNAFMKTVAGASSTARLIRAVEKEAAGKLKGDELTWLRSVGVNESLSKRLNKQFSIHKKDIDGLKVANVSEWNDRELAREFQMTIRREVDRTIVTPGLDKASFADKSAYTKSLVQFKSFAMASNQRMVLSALQGNEKDTIAGIGFLISLGTISYVIRQLIKGEDIETDIEDLLKEGIDRSGALGLFGEYNNIQSKLLGGTTDMYRLFGANPASRYKNRYALESLMGPGYGTINRAMTTFGNISQDIGYADPKYDLRETDIKNLRRMLPYNQVWWLNRLFNSAQDSISESVGAK